MDITLHAGVRVSLVRWNFIALSVFGGVGVLLYLWLWVMVPKDSGELHGIDTTVLLHGFEAIDLKWMRLTVRSQFLDTSVLLILTTLGVVILSRAGFASVRNITATLSIALGVGPVWNQAGTLKQQRSIRFLASIISGVTLLSLGILPFIARGDPPIILLRSSLVEAVIVAGVLFTPAPLWLRTPKGFSTSQAQQVRDAERADTTTHLHDSALQALTLIHASTGSPKRVWVLALSEERGPRSWFYTSRLEVVSSPAEVVRQNVGALENRFGAPIKAVAVSDVEPRLVKLALVTALGEAITNVLRHGSPPVSVCLEVYTEKIEAFIKDCGSGLDLDSIPHDRHGIRGSIIDRMKRVGGEAHIRIRSSGTEIVLGVPRKTKNIPRDAPDIVCDALGIPHDTPNTQGAS